MATNQPSNLNHNHPSSTTLPPSNHHFPTTIRIHRRARVLRPSSAAWVAASWPTAMAPTWAFCRFDRPYVSSAWEAP